VLFRSILEELCEENLVSKKVHSWNNRRCPSVSYYAFTPVEIAQRKLSGSL
jgi:hypothetical protein